MVMGGTMADDTETIALVRQLCTLAAMRMEDIHADLISSPPSGMADRMAWVQRVEASGRAIAALLNAAAAIVRAEPMHDI